MIMCHTSFKIDITPILKVKKNKNNNNRDQSFLSLKLED